MLDDHNQDDEEFECPLCMEEIDFTDRFFKPCPCGYRVCRFCWNHIKTNLNNLCPACRREYRDEDVQFRPPSQTEIVAYKVEKKRKEKEKKEMEGVSRRHLANMRVIRRNLVYVVGLAPQVCNEELLKGYEYFGQYGRIQKVVVNKKSYGANQSERKENHSYGVYITFARKEDASRCISTVDGTVFEGKVLRASYGTTKYCSYYLRGLTCQNSGCMYLHEPGEDADSFTKEDMASGKHHQKYQNGSSGSQYQSAAAAANNSNFNQMQQSSGGSQQHQYINQERSAPVLMGADGIVNVVAAPFGINAPHFSDRGEGSPVVTARASMSGPSGVSAVKEIPPTTSHEDWPTPQAATGSIPRASAWGNIKSSSSIPASTQSIPSVVIKDADGLECSLYDEICYGKHAENRLAGTVNTSSLHRYLFLAHQAKEYYSTMVQRSVNGNVQFAFDPFNVETGVTAAIEDSTGANSRFDFAASQTPFSSATKLSGAY